MEYKFTGSKAYSRGLNNLFKRTVSQDNLIIWQFLEIECNKNGLSLGRKLKYLRIISQLVRYFGEINDFNEDIIQKYFFNLKNQEYSPDTKQDYWNMFKIFGTYLNSELDFDQYKLKIKKNKKLPEDILSYDEITNLVKSTNSIRDKALISILYEAGCRVGELIGLKIKDTIFDEYGAVLIVDGKTGMRRIRIINSVPILSQYLQEHRFRDDINAPLFYRYDKHYKTKLTAEGINKILKKYAKKCKIHKRIYPHLFRHSRATHLAKHLTEQELKIYFGWVGDSKMASVYVHLSGKDIEDKILMINGIKSEDKVINQNHRPKECPRCNAINDFSAKFCFKCSQVLDIKEASGIDVKPDEFNEFMTFYKQWKRMKE